MNFVNALNSVHLPGLRKRQRLIRVWLVAAVACFGHCVFGIARAAAADSNDGEQTAIIAECEVQTIASASVPGMTNNAFMQVPRLSAIVSNNYRRGITGDWEIPSHVDANDPSLKFLLQTPRGPLVIKLDVLVDGRSFRKTREEWIDESLSAVDTSAPAKETPGTTLEPSESETDVSEDSAVVDETDPDAEIDDADNEPEVSETVAERFFRTDAVSRLKSYASQAKDVEREEARWLLAQWMPGPASLELRSGFARGRAQKAPLWAALDVDGDGQLDAVEISSSSKQLRTLDRNEDDWVDESELVRAQSQAITTWHSFPLLTAINDATNTPQLFRQLLAASSGKTTQENNLPRLTVLLANIGCQDISMLRPADLTKLSTVTPQLSIRTEFRTKQYVKTGLFVTEMSDGLQADSKDPVTINQAIGVSLLDCEIELAAVQLPAGDAQSTWKGQISVGAVIDGNPLLRQFDEDNDRRLALREIESIAAGLNSFDRNGNGSIELHEIPVPIRLTVALGANAHTALSKATSAVRKRTRAKSHLAPDWFVGMDGNKDGDLTVAEFLGTREQFEKLDVNGNQRISGTEATAQNNSTK